MENRIQLENSLHDLKMKMNLKKSKDDKEYLSSNEYDFDKQSLIILEKSLTDLNNKTLLKG